MLRLCPADPVWRALILPGGAPGIFAGLRLALIYAWLGNIGAEYFMSSGTGIGSLMITPSSCWICRPFSAAWC
ncbi:hypothetical protein UA70_28055 [Raoultella planticola]|nr:hypothetical protein UA70_28055 [Raoultella planticola]